MTVIAVTGHRDLAEATVPLVRGALRELLAAHPAEELTGLSCLAEGADALFAEAVLAHGGRLVAVLPSPAYRAERVGPGYAPAFDRLCASAAEILVLPHATADDRAFTAANDLLLARAGLLVAVWDGHPGNGPGGTAHAVAAARTTGLPVTVLWPPTATRTGHP
ncbi:hypothetical protein [Kitasatospora camelliae]|uniref:Uncharacterized protein n=1 Tax=Kitasatospora camelliae TaxID=3156397 RepID=A0AAU8JYS3_9ACTN